jgi:hypothetical protein
MRRGKQVGSTPWHRPRRPSIGQAMPDDSPIDRPACEQKDFR